MTRIDDAAGTPANTERRYEITRAQLPHEVLNAKQSCPTPEMALWNSHPRVYLPVEVTGTAACPYCGAVWVLKD